MPLIGVVALTFLACRAVVRSSMRTALRTFLLVVVLVPDTLSLPGPGMGYLPVGRIVLLAFAYRVARDVGRGDVWHRDLRLTRVHAAFACHLGVALLVGVVLAPPLLPVQPAAVVGIQLLEQVVAFTVVLVACRVIGDARWMARTFATVLLAALVVALVEHLTGLSWARWMLGNGTRSAIGSFPLETRGGELRVRAAAQFALAFAWVVAMLFPLLLANVAGVRRSRWLVVPLLAVAVVTWTGSRSALPALAASVLILVVAARFERPLVSFAVVAAAASVALVVFTPAVSRIFTSTEASGSNITRVDRLEVLTQRLAERPVRGFGLSSTSSVLGYVGADASFVVAYTETGVLGVVSLSVLLFIAVIVVGGGLRAPPGTDDRRLAAACAAALVMGIAGAAFHDLFSVPGSALVFWSIAGAGTAVAERHSAVRAPAGRVRVLLPVGGLLLGAILAMTAPRHAAVEYRFTTVPTGWDSWSRSDLDFTGKRLATTACRHLEGIGIDPRVRVRCRILDGTDGVGDVRVEAPDAATATTFAAALTSRVASLQPGFAAHALGPAQSGRPTAAATAPLWLGFTGLLLALLFPPPPLDRQREDAPGGARVLVGVA
jgi:hypothetical protein